MTINSEQLREASQRLMAKANNEYDDGYIVGETLLRLLDSGIDVEGLIQGRAWVAPNEPTKEMLHACAGAMSPAKRPTPNKVSVKEKHRIRYKAMRSAAMRQEGVNKDG